jgi:UbiD family decarboxylase
MANFSGMHMDLWGEMEMVGTIMDIDIEMVPCETIDLTVPAHAEIVVEGYVDLTATFERGGVNAPTGYFLPRSQNLPEMRVTAITMRRDRPIYRNHQTVPDTDHQTLPRLCHEAILFNRLSEIGGGALTVHDIRFPTWGAALSCIIQVEYPRQGFVNDALMQVMGAPWINTKMVVAISPDTDIDDAEAVYYAMASRVDPARDIIIVPNTRGSLYDPSAEPLDDGTPHRRVGKIGIDATAKPRHDLNDFKRAWPMGWGRVKLEDFLD